MHNVTLTKGRSTAKYGTILPDKLNQQTSHVEQELQHFDFTTKDHHRDKNNNIDLNPGFLPEQASDRPVHAVRVKKWDPRKRNYATSV